MTCLPAVTGNCLLPLPVQEPSRTDNDGLYHSKLTFSCPRGLSVGSEHGCPAGFAAAHGFSFLHGSLNGASPLCFFCFSVLLTEILKIPSNPYRLAKHLAQ